MSLGRTVDGSDLDALCRMFGVVVSYRDVRGGWRRSPRESLWAALRSLGAPLPDARAPAASEVSDALRERHRELAERPLPPVVVAWDGRLPTVGVRLPEERSDEPLALHVELAGGGERRFDVEANGRIVGRARIEGRRLVTRRLRARHDTSDPLPPGLHGLRIRGATGDGTGPEIAGTRLISAPSRVGPRSGGPGDGLRDPASWSLFAPLYALRDRSTAGVGDYGALARLGSWAADRGANLLATLPLLPLFLERPFDPSPYAPVSRLYWAELYLDLEDACERSGSAAGRALLESELFARRREKLDERPDVDYGGAVALRHEVLARVVAEAGGARALADRIDAFGRFVRERRGAVDFASFLAACERHRGSWRSWPAPARDAPLRHETLVAGRDFDPPVRDRHLVGQWLVEEQLEAVVRRGRGQGLGLYLDLPLSVHPDGYDVWRERSLFAEGMSVGAPPDAFFREGQDWGFPPPLAHAMRRSGYAYLRACLEHSMRPARALRVDHVMGLHRMFWIPRGATPEQGVYVRYPAREQYALLSLTAHRLDTGVVGEDLGTVPEPVRSSMRRHGVGRMFVVPFELDADRSPVLSEPGAESVAVLDTHDTWPFAGWWHGDDIEGWVELGMLDPAEVEGARARRARDRRALVAWLAERGLVGAAEDVGPAEALAGCLEALGGGPAGTVVASLEDLWLERRPQNIPGSPGAAFSWRRRAAVGLEALEERADARMALRRLDAARRGRPPGGETSDESGSTP